ncbi:uL30 family ribosomal protein [Candidatus Woesearchaeota archaeon]|nr:uL30 family ribosomal protein [Candidatus Woesearchaeota archaeon]
MAEKTETGKEKKQVSKKEVQRKETSKPAEGQPLAVVQVRGTVKARRPIIDTLRMLNLGRQNQCVILSATASNKGMLMKVKDYVTWGEVTPEMHKEVIAKRGRIFLGQATDRKKKYSYLALEFQGKKYLPYFHLNPPSGGYGKRGIKMSYAMGGALGYRKDKIKALLQRMR